MLRCAWGQRGILQTGNQAVKARETLCHFAFSQPQARLWVWANQTLGQTAGLLLPAEILALPATDTLMHKFYYNMQYCGLFYEDSSSPLLVQIHILHNLWSIRGLHNFLQSMMYIPFKKLAWMIGRPFISCLTQWVTKKLYKVECHIFCLYGIPGENSLLCHLLKTLDALFCFCCSKLTVTYVTYVIHGKMEILNVVSVFKNVMKALS